MADIYNKWLILAILLLLMGVNQFMYIDHPSAIFGFFIIPALVWLDIASSKLNFNLAKTIVACFLLTLVALSIASLLGFNPHESSPYNLSIDLLIMILCLILIIWCGIVIFNEYPNKLYILNAYNFLLYALATILVILTKFAHYKFFVGFLADLIVFNALIVAFYHLFNLDKLVNKTILYLPFYLIAFGIILILLTYFIYPNTLINFGHNLFLYIFIILLVLFLILILTNYRTISSSLSFYHTLFFLCVGGLLLTCFARGFLDTDSNLELAHIFSIFGIEILCCIVIYLFKVMEIKNSILQIALSTLILLIIFTKLLKDIFILSKGYYMSLMDQQNIDLLLSDANDITRHAINILIGLLLLTILYRFFFPDKTNYSQRL